MNENYLNKSTRIRFRFNLVVGYSYSYIKKNSSPALLLFLRLFTCVTDLSVSKQMHGDS